MRLGPTRELYAYWNAARRARPAPERADLDLTTVRGALPDLLALERDDESAHRIRHAGARVERLLGGEIGGRMFAGLWPDPLAAAEIDRLARLVEDAQQPLLAGVSARRGEAALACELLLLPLRCGGRTHARMLALLACGAPAPSAAPARLGAVASLRMLGVGEPGDPRRPLREGARRRGRLIVYEGGRRAAAE